jgi:hypothetical protein
VADEFLNFLQAKHYHMEKIAFKNSKNEEFGFRCTDEPNSLFSNFPNR